MERSTTNATTTTNNNNPGEVMHSIVEDDQQLYDWGIENRLDQYYQTNASGQGHPTAYEPSGDPGYVPNNHNAHAQQPLTESFNGNPDSHQHYTQLLPQSAPPPHVHPMPQQPHLPHHNGNTHFRPKAPPDSSPEAKGMPPQTYLPDTPIKTEPDPDATPSTPPFNYRAPPGRRPSLPPVDMDANELLKVERKRARNRVAASKCRLRKLERIAVLDQQASQLRAENEELIALSEKLKNQVFTLKQELRWHVNHGCNVFGGSNAQSASPDSTTPNNNHNNSSPTTSSLKINHNVDNPKLETQ